VCLKCKEPRADLRVRFYRTGRALTPGVAHDFRDSAGREGTPGTDATSF